MANPPNGPARMRILRVCPCPKWIRCLGRMDRLRKNGCPESARLGGITNAWHAEAWVAEKHEFHALEENTGRIPIAVGLQSLEVFVFEIIANRAGPAIAEARFFRVGESPNEAIHQSQGARLASGVAANIGHGAVRTSL